MFILVLFNFYKTSVFNRNALLQNKINVFPLSASALYMNTILNTQITI